MKTIARHKSASLPPRRQAGLTLVELMISITIGLILLLGITTLIVQQSRARNELEMSSRQIENGRYAMQLLHDDIQLAGFYGQYSPSAGVTYSTPNPCLTAPAALGWDDDPTTVAAPIVGYTGAAATPPSCDKVSNRVAGTAMLVIRRTGTTPIAATAAFTGTTYLQVRRCNTEGTPFLLGTTASISTGFNLHQMDCTNAAPLHKYIVRIYYVSSCDVCGSDSIPTLKMVEFMDGAQTTVPLVEGIENLQFDYGVDTDGDGSPDGYTTADTLTTPADWANVMAVRVNLLARNNDPSPGHIDNKTYFLGSVTIQPDDIPASDKVYKRHAYSELVRAINPSGRREQP